MKLTIDDMAQRIASVYGWNALETIKIQAVIPFGYGVAVVFSAMIPNQIARWPHPGIAIVHSDGVDIVKDTDSLNHIRRRI